MTPLERRASLSLASIYAAAAAGGLADAGASGGLDKDGSQPCAWSCAKRRIIT